MSEMAEAVERIKALVYADNIVEAYDLFEELTKRPDVDIDALMEVPEVSVLCKDMETAGICMEMLEDIGSWTPIYSDAAISTYCKGSGNEFFVRAELMMHQPLFPLFALFSEIDLFPEWVSVIKAAELLNVPSPYRRLMRFHFDMPWPVSDREATISVIGIPVPYNHSALIVIRSVDSSRYLNFLIPETPPNEVRIDISIACVNIVYKGPEDTQLSLIVRSDPQISILPQFLINFATKHVMYYLMDTIREKVKNYSGSEYERRVMQNTQYYETFRDKISAFQS